MARHIHPTPFIIKPPADMVQNQPDLKTVASQLASLYADGKMVVADEHLQTIGSALWAALNLRQSDFDAAHSAAGAAILPIIIDSGAPDVQALPWETLFHPSHGFIGKNPAFTLTRKLRESAASSVPLAKGPLRVLLFTSLPDDVDAEKGRLKVEDEQAQVQEALMPWIAKGVVQLEMPDDGRFSTLQALLKSFEPHVLFLSGHGRFHHTPHSGEAAYGAFYFESEIGDSEAIREGEIARVLIGSGVQAVILSACESSKTAPASTALNNGLAQRISAQGIAYVVGMRESIFDVAGIQFARALCDELASGERIDFALQAARIAIQTPFKDHINNAHQKGGISSAQAELSYGQWCLPMLISANPHNTLIDWDFQASPVDGPRRSGNTLGAVHLPARFIGRRTELRQYKNRLIKGELHSLLITAPGGQGKTSLAGKLALDMQKRGWQVFAWSARPENPWQEFLFEEIQMALDKERSEKYDRFMSKVEDDFKRAQWLLKLLMEQFNGRVILFLDNLESIQDPDTGALNDAVIAAWMAAARAAPGLILLATSRWRIPAWGGEHLTLAHANYGDFLQMAAGCQLPAAISEKRELRRVYDVLGGNSRGLEFFAAAVKLMQDEGEVNAFLGKLDQVKADLQANMAIEEIHHRLPPDAQKLLQRLPAYAEPVPREGVIKLGLDLPDPDAMLDRLLAVSLLEAGYEPHWQVVQYQCSPLVADWLRQRGLIDGAAAHLNAVADYHLYLFQHERDTLNQAIAAHHALRRAGRDTEADRLTLDAIVGPMTMAGLYATLLREWLPRICDAQDEKTRAEALGQTGKINLHIGNYDTALGYMKHALTIQQQIGDREGEGATLNNISQIYQAQGDYETALGYLKQALTIQQQIGDKASEGATLNNISTIYQAQGDYETALGYLKQSLTIRQQIGDKAGEGTTLNNISQIYDAQGDYETALGYLKQALTIRQQIGDKAGEGATLNNISQIHHAQGDYETALGYLKQALTIMQQIGNKAGEGVTRGNISKIYKAQGDYETALGYLKHALTIQQQIGDKASEGTTLNNISQIYHAQGDYETALGYLKQALTIQQQIGNKAGEGTTLNNISQIYKAQGDYETALGYLKQSLTIQQQIGDKAGLCRTLFNIGHIHRRNEQTQEAVNAWVNAYTIAKQINLAQVLQALSKLAPQLGLPEGLDGWERLAQHIQNGGSVSSVAA
jgi:tetratricopeptide (TPR) repeat protein